MKNFLIILGNTTLAALFIAIVIPITVSLSLFIGSLVGLPVP